MLSHLTADELAHLMWLASALGATLMGTYFAMKYITEAGLMKCSDRIRRYGAN